MYPRLCGDCLVPAIREMQQEEGKRAEETTRDTNPL